MQIPETILYTTLKIAHEIETKALFQHSEVKITCQRGDVEVMEKLLAVWIDLYHQL
jgi:hypothetical protein